jgi:DNA-binding SARP family transcriptional activator/tetratricopeptide (TPR) repeat protein
MITVRTLGVVEVRDGAGQPLAVPPKPLALLVYLALARPPGPQRRDRLVALFYPEKDEAHGRHALRQLLVELRTSLGAEILTNADRETAGVNRAALTCDAWTFEQTIAAGDFRAAVAAYGGPFLEGFHLPGCPDFEEWVACERMRLRMAFTGALEQLALRAGAEGRAQEAADWWRILLAHEPYATSVTLGLMEALARAGDRAGALEAAKAHAQRLREELGATPSAEVEALAERLQTRPVEHTGTTPTVAEQLAAALTDRYRLEGLVAVGGMALVYKAHDLQHDRVVAIKVLRPELAAALGPDRFLQEIAVTAELEHPGIVPVLDSGRAGGPTGGRADTANGQRRTANLLYYVMPFIAGESLRARLTREGPLPLDEAVRLTREVADALAHAHGKGIVHRDVKPENILLTGGHALVTDFGIARALEQAGSTTLTAPGVALGTPAYMSPEQAGPSRMVDARSDVYSLGCVLYELLAGHPPFQGTTAQELLARHATDPVPSLLAARSSVPASLEAVVYRALEKTPADRYATAGAFAEALAAPAVARHRPISVRWRRWAVGTAAGVVVITAGVATWRLTRPTSDGTARTEPPPYTIVAEVEGSAAAEVRQAVQALIATRTDQSGIVRTVPRGALVRGLALASLPDTTRLDERVARELAFRGGIRTVVAGRVDQLGGSFALTVRVLQAEDAAVVAAATAHAGTADELIPAVGQAVDEIRRTLGERVSEIRSTRVLIEVATPSFEAYLHFRRSWEVSEPADKLAELRQALTIDPEFAQAWHSLGIVHNNALTPDSDIAAWERAWELRDRLSDMHRANVEFLLAWYRDGDLAHALGAVTRGGLLNNRAILLAQELGRYDEAADILAEDRARQPFGPDPVIWHNSARALIGLGRVSEAESLITAAAPNIGTFGMAASAVSARHAWDELERMVRPRIADPTDRPPNRTFAAHALASALAARGRIAEAERTLRDAPSADRSLWFLTVIREAIGDSTAGAGPELARSQFRALWAAYRGDSALAMSHLQEAEDRRELGLVQPRLRRLTRLMISALLARHRGSYDEVITLLGTEQGEFRQNERWWLLAEAHERLGHADSAAAYLERFTAIGGPYGERNLVVIGLPYSFAHFRLGHTYVQLSQPDRAREHYRMFLETFTEPDPEYAWMVTEARAKLEEMGRSG